jgi:hypothetical protein
MNFLYFSNEQSLGENKFILNESQIALDRFDNKNHDFLYKFTTDNGKSGFGRLIQFQNRWILEEESLIEFKPLLQDIKIKIQFQRPQTAKKILHLTGCYGIGELEWFESDSKKNKEYKLSPTYQPMEMERFRIEGKEQSGNPFFTKLKLEWNPNTSFEQDTCVLDPRGETYLQDSKKIHKTYCIGRESGYTKEEFLSMKSNGIPIYKLGNTTTRTEFAYSILLNELEFKISSRLR